MDDFERWAHEQRAQQARDSSSESAVEFSIPLVRIDAGTAYDTMSTDGAPSVALRLWVEPESLPAGMANPVVFDISPEAALGAVQAMTATLETIMRRSRGQ